MNVFEAVKQSVTTRQAAEHYGIRVGRNGTVSYTHLDVYKRQDTGLGVSNISRIVDSLTKLPVMTVTTHVHWDHIGGHKYFDNIAVHEAEKDWLSVRFPIPLQVVKNNLTRLPCDPNEHEL